MFTQYSLRRDWGDTRLSLFVDVLREEACTLVAYKRILQGPVRLHPNYADVDTPEKAAAWFNAQSMEALDLRCKQIAAEDARRPSPEIMPSNLFDPNRTEHCR